MPLRPLLCPCGAHLLVPDGWIAWRCHACGRLDVEVLDRLDSDADPRVRDYLPPITIEARREP